MKSYEQRDASATQGNSAQRGERDYPIGDPRAADYNGEKYTPPSPPYARDYPKGHPSAADSDENIAQSERDRKERTPEA
jgi:hypothetical protein